MDSRNLLIKAYSAFFFCVLLAGCGSFPRYLPPAETAAHDVSTVVQAGFDKTWSGLVEMLATTFYPIDLLDKNSGFIRLDFTAYDPSKYVDCGMVTEKLPMLSGDEGFAGLFAHYAILEYGWQLRVRINVLAKPIGEGQTEVRVHALYTFGDFVFETGSVAAKNIWTRDSGGGLDSGKVTCKPTHVVEQNVLEWARSAEAAAR